MTTFKLRISLSAGALGALVCAAPALAADIPVKAVPVVSSVYNWTGLYGGVHVGYGYGMKDWLNSSFDYKVKGFLGGGQVGVNQQIGNLVIGIEADASWANINGDQTVTFGGALAGGTQRISASTKIDALATLTGRLGFAQDRSLVYVKGGAAWAHEKHDFAFAQTVLVPGAVPLTQTATAGGSEDRFGWVFGIGSEVALWGNWSFKSEYNYVRMENRRVRLDGTVTNGAVVAPFTANADILQTLHLAKFGVNYRFGPDGPPAIAPSRPTPGYDWSGAWVGVQAGFGFGRKHWADIADPFSRFDVKGWIAGTSTGANAQAGVFVVGAESEWLWTNIHGSNRSVVTAFGTTQTLDLATKVDWLSLNSFRVGFVTADRWLVYGKGGIALAHETHDLGVAQVAPGVGSITAGVSGSGLHTGYLLGAGVEYAFLGNWSAKLEYNYLNFRLQNVLTSGLQNFNVPPATVGTIANFQRVGIREDMHLVKFGINYHFTSLADVITAKY